MRILHVTNVDMAGGTNTNCLEFIRASPGDNTLVVLDEPGQMQPRWARHGIRPRYLEILQGDRRRFARELGRVVDDGGYQLVLLWCCIRVPLIRFALGRSQARLGIHLGNPYEGGRSSDLKLRAQAWLLRSEVKTKFFSCSEHVRASYAWGYWEQFENQVIYNPVEFRPVPPDAGEGLVQTPPCLGMVARLDRIKDHATLLWAVRILRARGIEVDLELVGDGPLRPELERLVTRLDLGLRVRFTGYLDDVLTRVSGWTLFVYSTTEREGLGNSVVEALGAGVPCVVSDLPMMREIDQGLGLIRFFRAGDATDCADHIGAALQEAQLRPRLSEVGRQRVRTRHDPSRYCTEVTEFMMADPSLR